MEARNGKAVASDTKAKQRRVYTIESITSRTPKAGLMVAAGAGVGLHSKGSRVRGGNEERHRSSTRRWSGSRSQNVVFLFVEQALRNAMRDAQKARPGGVAPAAGPETKEAWREIGQG